MFGDKKEKPVNTQKLSPQPKVVKTKKATTFKPIIKTTSPSIPETSRVEKRLQAEKAVLTGRLAQVENLLQLITETPEIGVGLDIILNPLEIDSE